MDNISSLFISAIESSSGILRDISREAGRMIMKVYAGDFSVMEKEDSSPLTEADLASHNAIVDGLAGLPEALSSLPVMSEEGRLPQWNEYKNWKAWWLIDPLDGTKEFVKRNGEFTVNIALIVRTEPDGAGIPLAGWVYAPVPDVLYEGISNRGAIRIQGDTGSHEKIPVAPSERIPRIVASRSHRSPETEIVIDAVAGIFGEIDIVSSGSSLKLCRIAEGSAELYPRCAPTMEWDTAAADAVCRASGCRVVNANSGEDLEYGKEDLLNPWFLVSADLELLKVSVESLEKP